MSGYTRNDTGNNIADGNVINASDLDGEFDAVEAAFNNSTGHTHDGTSAEGAPIEVAGPAQDLVITATEVRPKTDNTLDLGTTTLEFKDAFFDGTVKTDTLTVDENATVTGNLTVNGNTTLGNAATDTVTVTADVASDLIPSADGTYDLGASGSEWQDLYIDGTANIDSLVADTADINGGTIDSTTIGGSTPAAGSFTTVSATGDVDIADKIVHTGDTNTAIRFPAADTVTFETAGSEAMRIDSSGNLLVGKTTQDQDVIGAEIRENGISAFTASGSSPLRVNRKTSEGNILNFQKDGSTVGSIGTHVGSLTIGDGTAGLKIDGSNNIIEPWNLTGNTGNDNNIDLGYASGRFKDLYLSGGVYLGGTGAANYIEDYEEGTWTPTTATSGYTISSSSGFYTKVGRLVTLHFRVIFSAVPASNSSVGILGQPFESSSNSIHQPGICRESSSTGAIYVVQVNQNSNTLGINSMDGVSSGSNRTLRTSENYDGFACYTTSA